MLKKKKNWEMGEWVWTEEEMKENKWDGWGGIYVCGGAEEKRKAGDIWVVGKKKTRK